MRYLTLDGTLTRDPETIMVDQARLLLSLPPGASWHKPAGGLDLSQALFRRGFDPGLQQRAFNILRQAWGYDATPWSINVKQFKATLGNAVELQLTIDGSHHFFYGT